MLCKPNELDYTSIKAYRMINLLNSQAKVCKKVVADMLAKWCTVNHVLHSSEIGSRRQRSVTDTVARVVKRVQDV